MRIAIIAPPWVPVPPPAYGGIEAVIDTLARGLAAGGQEVLLFTTADSTCPVDRDWVYDSARGIAPAEPAIELRHVMEAYEAASSYDVVHDHTVIGPVYADRYPWLPVVTTNHGPFLSDLGAVYQQIGGRVPVIAISHHQASTAKGIRLAGVIHHGVETADFPVGTGSGGYAFFLGRMSPDKGVHRAVLAARASGVPLLIAAKMSEPQERAYFDATVKPLLGGGAEYIGEVGGAEKLHLLGDALCLLNPIEWPEPFGMVMIESLATGTPVVATRRGSAPEIVDDGTTGLLVTDDQQLVSALHRVGKLDRSACRQAAEKRFSAERMVTDHLAVYEAIAVERGGTTFQEARQSSA